MAITATNLIENQTSSAGTGFTTASISPGSNKLILLSVNIRNGSSTEPTVSSISGNGLTWVLVNSIYYDTAGSSRKKHFLYRAMGASPSAGAITFTAGQSNTHYTWVVDEIDGIDTGGTNGSSAVVQSTTNKEDGGNGGELTVTLAAFSNAGNATYGSFGDDTEAAATVGSGFSEVGRVDSTATIHGILTEFKTANDTSVDVTYTAGTGISTGGIAVEIKASVASTSVKDLIGGGFIPFAR